MSTAGSPTSIDERLARLAPAASPDPERLAAARAVLDEALDGTGPSRSRRVGDAHVLDLDAARAHRHDDTNGDAALPLIDDDVVVPLVRGRTARERRRRRVQLGAAAAGVVGIVAVGLVLAPRPAPGPASPADSCASSLTASAVPDGLDLDPAWAPLAHETVGGADLTMLRSPATGMTGFCSYTSGGGGTTSTSTLWTTPAPEAEDGEVTFGGVAHDDWYVAWGDVGADASAVRLEVEPPRDTASPGSVLVVDAVRDGAGWTVMMPGDRIPADARVSLRWREHGVERSLALDSAWPEDGGPVTALTDQRRTACVPGWRGNETTVEDRRGEHGVTMVPDRASGWFTACVQEAAPPYTPLVTSGGELPAEEPASDEAVAVSGSGGGGAGQLVGVAGDGVARVEVRTADGTRLVALVSDGYWVAWSADLVVPTTPGEADEGPWDGATMAWYDADGEPLGQAPVFP
ncbi:hypothetical protein [Isoptericola sp. NPDC057391]|uniref:hypothetical protein n=1 Tax=Isoptericola sp. NPDC057391 TaxID=3346117 RepID=UPI0036450EE6